MEYTKKHRSLEEQADLLLARGMQGDREQILDRLATVNYYRLSGYWYTFRKADGVTFAEGTAFDEVWRRYVFDRQLRLLVMDAIERIEIALRTCLAYHHSEEFGPFGYAENPHSLPELKPAKEAAKQTADAAALPKKKRDESHADFLRTVRDEHKRSRDQFVEHFDKKYGDTHDDLPLWVAIELMSFGTMFTFYNGVDRKMKQNAADLLGVSEVVATSWIRVFNTVRNIVAHHGRLWNRELGTTPMLPRQRRQPPTHDEWHVPVEIPQEKLFPVLTILLHCLRHVAPTSRWWERLLRLLKDQPPTTLAQMGFPDQWHLCPLWQSPHQ